ncbi:CAP domain-containing protein [Romboutsia sp. 13368]|uniref:CAP domain-containing protein n=1 Tax=Romboutsia sp. 13368 TaxID=2708053 RepID=UPI0025D799DA|nr:CAP domain-containing protein [Romboutsia sp. 13368]
MGQRTPKEVVNAWMNSKGHRENILNPNFTTLGVGIAKDSNGSIYWTQMFIGK